MKKKKIDKFTLISRTCILWLPILAFSIIELNNLLYNLPTTQLIKEKLIAIVTCASSYEYIDIIILFTVLGFLGTTIGFTLPLYEEDEEQSEKDEK